MLRALLGLAAMAVRVPAWLACAPHSDAARRIERGAYAAVARGFGIETELAGTAARGPVLFVANHIGWCDIPVLGAAIDAAFVAKSEVARWPLIGALARRTPAVFVARGDRGASGTQVEAIRTRLRAGRSVLLFPEGTTSDGRGVLAFRSSLFAAADCAACIQPVALSYLDRNGLALRPERLREVAWIDDDALLASARRLARAPLRALVQLLPPLPDLPRKQLAAEAEARIRAAHAAAPNRERYRSASASTGATRNTSTVLN